jgi:hypothetical protein
MKKIFFVLASVLIATSSSLFSQKSVNPTGKIPAKNNETVTIRNETYGFEIAVPKNWTFRKGIQADPEEGMKSGSPSFSMNIGSSEKEPKEWNGIVFNSVGTSDNPQPYVSVYCHKKPGQKPEEFAKLFESTVKVYRGQITEANSNFSVGDAKGLDYKYTLFVKNRYVILYKNGTRLVIHYYLPAAEPSLFDKYAPVVDAAVKSIKIR